MVLIQWTHEYAIAVQENQAMQQKNSDTYRPFPPTDWRLVNEAALGSTKGMRDARNQLLETYGPVMRSFLLYKRWSTPDEVHDHVNGFILSRVLEQGLFAKANQSKGKFRSFLLTALKRYIIDLKRKECAQARILEQKRSEAQETQGIQDNDVSLFEVQWARHILIHALVGLRESLSANGKKHLWDLYVCRKLRPIVQCRPEPSYRRLVAQFGLDSETQAANLVFQINKKLAERIRLAVRESVKGYIGDDNTVEEEVEKEIANLRTILSRAQKVLDAEALLYLELGSPDDPKEGEDISIHDVSSLEQIATLTQPGWEVQELALILTQQLSLPLPSLAIQRLAEENTDNEMINTVGELLAHQQPPLRAIRWLKKYATINLKAPSRQLPPPVAEALYYASIVAAKIRCGAWLTRVSPDSARKGLESLLEMSWIDPAVQSLLQQGFQSLDTT